MDDFVAIAQRICTELENLRSQLQEIGLDAEADDLLAVIDDIDLAIEEAMDND